MIQEKFCAEEEYSEGEHAEPLSQTLRIDTELFKEEDDIAQNVISVKRVDLPKGGEDWEIIDNNLAVLTLKGMRFSKKEKLFLRTPKGFLFLMDGYKNGWKTITKFKKEIKRYI